MDPLQILPQELGSPLWWPALTFSGSGSTVSVLHCCTAFGCALELKVEKIRERMGKWQEIWHCYHLLWDFPWDTPGGFLLCLLSKKSFFPGEPWESRSWRSQHSFCDPELPSLPERSALGSGAPIPGLLLYRSPNFGWGAYCYVSLNSG